MHRVALRSPLARGPARAGLASTMLSPAREPGPGAAELLAPGIRALDKGSGLLVLRSAV